MGGKIHQTAIRAFSFSTIYAAIRPFRQTRYRDDDVLTLAWNYELLLKVLRIRDAWILVL
jgi:hypothetical protein